MRIGRRCRRFLARIFVLGVGALMASTLTPCSGSAASQQKVLYSFCAKGGGDYCTDGEDPEAGLTEDGSGNLYGTTVDGGADGAGTVFELTPNKAKTAWVHKVLYRFCAQGGGNCTDGAYPDAGLIQDASGHLYGTTEYGGAVGDGTVFELTPPAAGKTAWKEKVLYSFCQQAECTDGELPEAGLTQDASGSLYGTTYEGGTGNEGTVFELTPPAPGKTAWKEIVLYSFCAQGDCTDGENPEARAIRDASTGNLYGTTYYGGANGEGTVFELTPPATGQSAWTESVLYSFCAQGGRECTDGEQPRAHLIRDPSGKLYGTTTEGGAYLEGTVFELTPPTAGQTAWTEIVLHSFCARGGRDCTDGEYPEAGLIRDTSGNLYGTTDEGGADGGGTVFELTPPAVGQTTWMESVLYNFCAQGDRNCTDGSYPEAGLMRDKSGNLYGTTSEGGAHGGAYGYGGGTVFELVKEP
jgi:uncharacterized repeat protein (TIGR03803 family)